jgi:Ser/Thr protein kinase RdoA (MazF antagonist)
MGLEKESTHDLFDRFQHSGCWKDIVSFGSGHIHETFLVRTAETNTPDYLLQKINCEIFNDIQALMHNIRLLTAHLAKKKPVQPVPVLVLTIDGQPFYTDRKGNKWRMFEFIPESETFQEPPSTDHIYEAGKAIGTFQSLLADLKTPLFPTIPRFHDLEYRLHVFRQVLNKDPVKRSALVSKEINTAFRMAEELIPFRNAISSGLLPIRITHNDTKLNNVLFDKTGRAICLIDLDTVMPGLVHYDFGDAVRTMTNLASEDEQDLAKVTFQMENFRALAGGYLESTQEFLTLAEKEWLPEAGFYMTFIIGLRFLTDHLNGDIYFKVHRTDHNLDRVRVQFRMISEMKKFRQEMQAYITQNH